MRTVIITARAGSQRIPGKNKKPFHGIPIIAHSLIAARVLKREGRIDQIVVSTDDDEIRDIAWEYGAQYLEREPAFAQNEVGTKHVMAREIERLGLPPDAAVCCLYPTAPMVLASDLAWGCELLRMRPAYFVVAVGTQPLADAGQFYWSLAGHWLAEWLPIYGIRTAYYPIPPERCVDINLPEDWARAERMYAALMEKEKTA